MTNELDNRDITIDYNAAIRSQINRLADLLMRKNRDYGNAAFLSPALAPNLDSSSAILVRMSDKIQRLTNLAKALDARVVDESFNDTVLDLAGYCLLYLVSQETQLTD